MRKMAVLTGALSLVVALSPLASAHEYQVGGPNPDAGEHVTICHATGNGGYVEISPSVTGVATAHVTHQDGQDIIPPFHFHVNVGSRSPEYEGREFAGQGDQSILANGCNFEGEPTVPTPHAKAEAFCVDGTGQEDFPGDNLGIVEVDSWITPDDYEGVLDFQVTLSNPYQQERYTVFPGSVYNESYLDHEGTVRVQVATEDHGVFFDKTFVLECDVAPEPSPSPNPEPSPTAPPVDDGTDPPAPRVLSDGPQTDTVSGTASGSLPFTGYDLSDLALIAAVMLISGAGAWWIARRQGF